MKNVSLFICLLFTMYSFSQDNPEKITEDIKDPDEIPYAVIENVPIYSGCDKTMSNRDLKACMSTRIGNLISRNFNLKLANSLNLPAGKVRISVIFKIDKEGNIIDVRARAPHPELEKEAIRIIHLIPKMQSPGFQRGKPVIVPYSLPIVFVIDAAKPLSKKEQRKLKKKNRS